MNLAEDGLEVAELELLGGILADGGQCMDDFVLSPDEFTTIQRERVYTAMTKIRASGGTVTQSSVVDTVSPADFTFVMSIEADRHLAYNAAHNAAIIHRHAVRVKLGAVGPALAELPENATADEMIERAGQLIDQAAGMQRSKLVSMTDLWQPTVDMVTSEIVYMPSPWRSLDDAIGGLRAGALYVIGARPGIGKSVVALQMAMKLAENGVVAYSSLEMPALELNVRGIAAAAEVNVSRLARNRLSEPEWAKIAMTRPHYVHDVYIDDRSGVGPAQVRQFAREVSRKGNLRAIVVDYIQLMTSPGTEKRYEKVGEFTRQLKIMAKDLGVPVIALSQLNRQSESRPDAKPMLSELRESGSIEQDADVVILLSREDDSNLINFDVAKNRHGKTALVELQWRGEHAKIRDYKDIQGR